MITKRQLAELTKKTDLNLYQQEKDYLLKIFLYNYYRKYTSTIFKGGTCIRYFYGLNRFSEDLDFNITNTPKKFEKEVRDTLKEIERLGIKNYFIRKEIFPESFTCEIAFQGPLYVEDGTRNKFRIDAGKRTGVIKKPHWQMINSEYADTPPNYLVLAMDDAEILAEKIIALMKRKKGRDLYDIWYMTKKGVRIDKKLLNRKAKMEDINVDLSNIPSKREYSRDMGKLTNRMIPYEQVIKEMMQAYD